MRMWMVNPASMCRRHLLGEHVELHMLAGSILRGKSIAGFLEKGLVAPQALVSRHEALVREMKRRGYSHASPLPRLSRYTLSVLRGKVSVVGSYNELKARCEECAGRQAEHYVLPGRGAWRKIGRTRAD